MGPTSCIGERVRVVELGYDYAAVFEDELDEFSVGADFALHLIII